MGDSAQVAIGQVAESQQNNPSEMSDWFLLVNEEFQELKAKALGVGSPSAPTIQTKTLADDIYADVVERVADPEAEGPRRSN